MIDTLNGNGTSRLLDKHETLVWSPLRQNTKPRHIEYLWQNLYFDFFMFSYEFCSILYFSGNATHKVGQLLTLDVCRII